MNIEELKASLSYFFDHQNAIGITIYAISKLQNQPEPKKLDIEADAQAGLKKLFLQSIKVKIVDVDEITRFEINCLRKVFDGCVLDEWLPLGRNGNHWYSLIFAMANPSPKAVKAGKAIARHIMRTS